MRHVNKECHFRANLAAFRQCNPQAAECLEEECLVGWGGGAAGSAPGMLPLEQSYIENILRLNKGKLVHVFTTFENNNQWNAKEFVGIIEAAGRDHLILSDPQTGKRYLIPMVHLDYVTFEEEVEYESQFGGGGMATYPPR